MRGTVLPALMVFAAYFLLLYAGVGFLQDKRFFGSAPKENLAAIPDRKERFPGAHAIGWALAMAALKRRRLLGAVIDRIHTRRDTILKEENIEYIVEGLLRLTDHENA